MIQNINVQFPLMEYDLTDPTGKLLFNILATFAEFEADRDLA